MASLIRIPPERYASPPSPAGAGCCCCCCCLHSVGGLLGAAIASGLPPKDEDGEPASAANEYWLSVIFACLLTAYYFWYDNRDADGALLMVLLVLPLVQLGGSVFALAAVACSPKARQRLKALHLTKITACSVLGALIGWLLMGL